MRQQGSVLFMSVVILAALSLLIMTMQQSQQYLLQLLHSQQLRNISLEQAENILEQLVRDNQQLLVQQFEEPYCAQTGLDSSSCEGELFVDNDYPESVLVNAKAQYLLPQAYWKLTLHYQSEHRIVLEVAVRPKNQQLWTFYD